MYSLVEIFESLQGEGRNTGRPCVFIRFAGCNLSCAWCDTIITPSFEISCEDLISEVKKYRAKSVVLTGGEPTLVKEMPELIAALKNEGYYIAVETNGTIDAPWLSFVDYVACSPKSESNIPLQLATANEVRIVASENAEKIISFCNKIKEQIIATDYYVSPCDHNGEIDFATAKEVLSKLDGWSLSVQLHKILGFR